MTRPEKTLCFLVGAPRSGTTWIQRLLQSHPLICGGEESHFFRVFGAPLAGAEQMHDSKHTRHLGPLSYVSQEEYEDLFRLLWVRLFESLYAENPTSVVHLEKTPFHALCLGQIQRIFPDARILFLTRDSRAVTSSLVHAGRTWGDYWAPDSYREAALEWYRHVLAVKNWRNCNPDHPFLQVRYEDAVRNPREELERMLRFLLPDVEDLQADDTLRAFDLGQSERKDPEGFSRNRGMTGWKADMSLYGKVVTWRYTRKLMRELGYGISILD